MGNFVEYVKKNSEKGVSEQSKAAIDNIFNEMQEVRVNLMADIRDGNLPLETYDLDDRCKELVRKEELMLFLFDKIKCNALEEDIVENLAKAEKPLDAISQYITEDDIWELQENEYKLALEEFSEEFSKADRGIEKE